MSKLKFRVLFLSLVAMAAGLLNGAWADDVLTDAESSVIAKLPKVPRNLNRGFRIVRESAKVIQANLALKIEAPNMNANTWVFALPKMPNTTGQDIRQFATNPPSKEVIDKSPVRSPICLSRIEVHSDDLKSTASFHADVEALLYKRALVFDKIPATALDDEKISIDLRRLFLRPSTECDYTAELFKNWKAKERLSRLPREGEVQFAQRVFRYLATSYRYLFDPKQTRTASNLCQSNSTDCGGLSTLFASIMRSEGIPARTLAGRWAKSAKEGELLDGQKYYQYHVKAEFYADGVGWIPVDLSSAILHDKTQAKLNFFGQDLADFIVFHIDTGIEFDSELFGDHRFANFQIPQYWVKGKGNLDDRTSKESWTVTEVKSAGRSQ